MFGSVPRAGVRIIKIVKPYPNALLTLGRSTLEKAWIEFERGLRVGILNLCADAKKLFGNRKPDEKRKSFLKAWSLNCTWYG